MKKIAIINQRYGPKVNGGSEYYTRLIAEHLNPYYNVEVLTTTALDYDTWKNFYKEGEESVNGVRVRRFPVKRQRNMFRFRLVNKLHLLLSKVRIDIDKLWVKEQGPYAPLLIQYIKEHKKDYDIFVFVTYLYYTTVMGMPEVADKAVLIPTAHDEPYIYFPIYKSVFQRGKSIIYLTEEERSFVNRQFHNEKVRNEVIGVGIDIPAAVDPEKFRSKFGIQGEYLIYAGRVDLGKNCDEMFEFFLEYKKKNPKDPIQLVVIGKNMIEIPRHPHIHYLGFVSEEDKYNGISGARFLWLPSRFESLSIALLEAMALGVPGIVNGNCEVLKGHCDKSSGALYYKNQKEFERLMLEFVQIPDRDYKSMQENARSYVKEHYQWNIVINKLRAILEPV